MGDLPNAPKPKQGLPTIVKVLLGCGCLMVVLVAAVVGGGALFISSRVACAPTKVATFADRALPGAKAPAGYEGKFGFDIMVRIAVFGPTGVKMDELDPGVHTQIMVIGFPSGANMNRSQMRMQARQSMQQQGHGEELQDVEALGTETFTLRGASVEFEKARGKSPKGGKPALHYFGVIDNPGGAPAGIMLQGPEATFDRAAVDAFLASIK